MPKTERHTKLPFSHQLERFYFKLGLIVAGNPGRTIAVTLFVVAFCSLGFVRFYQEKNPLKLWVPAESKFVRDTLWIMDNFQDGFRSEKIIFRSRNMLRARNLLKVHELRARINAIVTHSNVTINDVCVKIPNVKNIKQLNIYEKYENPIRKLIPDIYCYLLNNLAETCLESNVLEVWQNDRSAFENKSSIEIGADLKRYQQSSKLFGGHYQNYNLNLGGIERWQSAMLKGNATDADQEIAVAETLLMSWFLYVNFSQIDIDRVGNRAGTADWATENVLSWEQAFEREIEQFRDENPQIEVFYESARRFADVTNDALFKDTHLIIIGNILMVMYVVAVISKFNELEFKLLLGTSGIFLIALAFAASCGFCLLLGIPYGPVHASLPFLLLGLGVDDMFVILAAWYKIKEQAIDGQMTFNEKIAYSLSHAGVSITMTTLTDVIAFCIGCSTILPSLFSFCIYAAVGILFTFFGVITCFIAILVLDEKRMEQTRHAINPFRVIEPAKTIAIAITNTVADDNNHARKSPGFCLLTANTYWTRFYSNVILTKPAMVLILTATVILTAFNGYHIQFLETNFDKNSMVPAYSSLLQYYQIEKMYYPLLGYDAAIFVGRIDYSRESPKLFRTVQLLRTRTDLVTNLVDWTFDFDLFLQFNYQKNLSSVSGTAVWSTYLSDFLFSPIGAKYRKFFKFETNLECNQKVPNITASIITFQFLNFNNSKQWLNAMHSVNEIVRETNLTSGSRFITTWAKIYGSWTTEEIIETEISRNLAYTLVCVFLCTFIVVRNYLMCAIILLCVLLTMVNVCGLMYQMAIAIDIVTCISLELAIGLCIDYASHISHAFLNTNAVAAAAARTAKATTPVDKSTRILQTIESIGLAVVFGGFATILSLAMLIKSEIFVFVTLFKIFFMVVSFGLFFGVVLLPILLYLANDYF